MSSPALRFSVAAEGQRELVEQLAQVALQLLVLPQPEQLERRHEGVGDFSGVDTGHVRRSAGEPDRKQPGPFAGGAERQDQRARCVQAAGKVRHLPDGVGDEHRHAARGTPRR